MLSSQKTVRFALGPVGAAWCCPVGLPFGPLCPVCRRRPRPHIPHARRGIQFAFRHVMSAERSESKQKLIQTRDKQNKGPIRLPCAPSPSRSLQLRPTWTADKLNHPEPNWLRRSILKPVGTGNTIL